MFPQMKRDRVFEKVSREIKQQIFQGILKPGDKLPPENELARKFNVSRQSIRESMRILELSGFITIKRGVNGGPFIENTISSRVSEGLAEAIQMGPATLDDFILAWQEIERIILALVVKNADEADLKELHDNCRKAKKKLSAKTPIFKEGIRFHQILAIASKNHIFEIVIDSILAVYTDYLSRLEPNYEAALKVLTLQEQTITALAEKNEEKAMHWLNEQFHFLKIRLKSIETAAAV